MHMWHAALSFMSQVVPSIAKVIAMQGPQTYTFFAVQFACFCPQAAYTDTYIFNELQMLGLVNDEPTSK